MKNLIVALLFLLVIISCDKFPGKTDYAGVPKSSKIAEKQGLLISKYLPSQKTVFIDGEKYEITDSWSSYRFRTKNSSEITKTNYEFLFDLRNVKTGKSLIDEKTTSTFLNKSVRNLEKNYGYSIGIGIESRLLSINYLKKEKPISPEIIKIEFKNGSQRQCIEFKKASH